MSDPSRGADRAPLSLLPAIGCLSAAIVIVELTLTRVFSVTMFYHFAFLAISVAMFGLSASAVFVYVTPRLHPFESVGRQLQTYAALFWAVATASAILLLRMRMRLDYSAGNAVRMIGIYLLAAAPFMAGGAGLALAVSRFHRDIGRVYAADLCGAAGGCLLLIPVLNAIGAPGAMLLAAGLGALSSLLFAIPYGRLGRGPTWIPAAAAAVALALQLWHPWLDVYGAKGHEDAPLLFSKWNSFSRIAVYDRPHPDWGLSDTYQGPLPASRYMDIDAAASTPILDGSGGVPSLGHLRYELTALAYTIKPGAHVLVIGPGGGRDLWTALVHGARQVEGVEVNPIIVRDVMKGRFREYSGNIYGAPGVSVEADDGRSYVSRSPVRYDLIQASLVDTWAATTAGAFAMTENNLYTAEAFESYVDHLQPDGVLTITRWYADGLRLLSLVQAAGQKLGWPGIADRVFIGRNGLLAAFVFKKSPLTNDEIDRLQQRCRELNFTVVYSPVSPRNPTPTAGDAYARLATTPYASLPEFYKSVEWDITPSTDDRPFFFRSAKPGTLPQFRFDRSILFGNGSEVLSGLLLISVVLLALFVFVPLAWLSPEPVVWRELPLAPLAYFACLGAGFMFVEMGLMQRFVLLLGHPVYSLSVILFTLLLGGGVGSAFSRRLGSPARILAIAIPAIIVVSLAYSWMLPSLFASWVAWPRPGRIMVSIAYLFPLGLLLGMPLPAGIRVIGERKPGVLAWAWGLNGAMSVLGATLAIHAAMSDGFARVALYGAIIYAVAGLIALWMCPRPPGASER
jgi:spermidine synthase